MQVPRLSTRFLAFSGLMVAAVLWGSTFVLIQESFTHDLFYMLAVRFGIAALGVALLLKPKEFLLKGLPEARSKLLLWAWLGFFLVATFAPQAFGLLGTSVANSSVITSLYIVLTPFFIEVKFSYYIGEKK